VGENDPGILAHAAFVLAYFRENTGATIALVDRALTLNPSYAASTKRARSSPGCGPPARAERSAFA
jgi:hypothetical protein